MVGTIGALPLFWAQAAGPGLNAPTPVSNAAAVTALALRRWCGSLTLSSPDVQPGLFPVWAWLGGLGALLAVVLVFQGPGRALRQLFDFEGHVAVVRGATARLRRAGRLVTVTIGLTVLSWTGSQGIAYDAPQGKSDVLLLTKTRGLGEIAVEQGALAALTPLRDVAGLAGNLPLVALATLLLFRATAENWGVVPLPGTPVRPRPSGWATVGWCSGAVYGLYRLVSLATGSWELPLGGCLVIEAALVPALTLLVDGTLLAWALAELRAASFERAEAARFDVGETVGLMPGAALACALALPSRYVASSLLLVSLYLPASVASSPFGGYLRWQLGRGLAEVQAGALAFAGIVGAVAWTRGSAWEAFRVYRRMLASEGVRTLLAFGAAGAAAAVPAGAAYALVLALPTATWLLAAADSYAHYATLPVGLWLASALVELAERSLPEARPAEAL